MQSQPSTQPSQQRTTFLSTSSPIDLKLLHNTQQRIFTVDPHTTIKQFRTAIAKIFSIKDQQLVITVDGVQGGNLQTDDTRSLEQAGVTGQMKVRVKNIGKQIKWEYVFYIQYVGPILIVPIFYLLGKRDKYQLVQHTAAIMSITHYIKRELQTKFIHKFSRKTMPFKRVFINSAHYWILFGLLNSIELFMFPKQKMKWDSNQIVILFLIWAFMQFCNFKCHQELSSLRNSKDKKQRGIPKKWGFQFVSCANYLWESLGWLTFSIMTNCVSSYVFTAVSVGQMVAWALKKHEAYKKQFKEQYPKNRKAIIPFVL